MLPVWMRWGACVGGKAHADWTPQRKDNAAAKQARRWCSVCPVRAKCLDYALADPELTGIYAGTDDDERDLLRDFDTAAWFSDEHLQES